MPAAEKNLNQDFLKQEYLEDHLRIQGRKSV